MKSLCLGLALAGSCWTGLHGEDWTTRDGTTYTDVVVKVVEPDSVTIENSDGGARIALADLPPALQKRFHYDPVAAAAAAKVHAEEDAQEKADWAARMNAAPPAATTAPVATPPSTSLAETEPPAARAPVNSPETAAATTPAVDKAALQSQIDALNNLIASLKQQIQADDAQDDANFNSRENTYTSSTGETEHYITESHSTAGRDARGKLHLLEDQLADLQAKLTGDIPRREMNDEADSHSRDELFPSTPGGGL
jgi:hypothetical protein